MISLFFFLNPKPPWDLPEHGPPKIIRDDDDDDDDDDDGGLDDFALFLFFFLKPASKHTLLWRVALSLLLPIQNPCVC